MNAPAALRVGRCPGALRPMMSRDGLIVRLKPRGAALTAAQAAGIAAGSARHGSGLLDLTARANLQVRGVTEASLPDLTAELGALGLLDADAGAEARRNVVASPLMGFDRSAAFDARPAVAALEAALAAASDLAALPAKFGFTVSDGGAMPLGGASADVHFDALPGERFAVRLDGDAQAVATCAAERMPEVALRLARAFASASTADPAIRRMRDLAAAVGAGTVAARAGVESAGPASPPPPCCAGSPSPNGGGDEPDPPHLLPRRGEGSGRIPMEGAGGARPSIGILIGPVSLGDAVVLGVAAAFGRLDAAQLDGLVRGAARAGAGELRVAPWRALVIPALTRAAAERLAAEAAASGLIVDPDDPRLRVAACAGATGCRRGTTPVLEHAGRWSKLLRPGSGIALHVSGCAKGCAHPGPAPLTLVAADGRYGLVVSGTAADLPVAAGLDADGVRRLFETALRPDLRP